MWFTTMNDTVTRNHTYLYEFLDCKPTEITSPRMSRSPLSIHEFHHGWWGTWTTTMKETVTRKRTDKRSTTMKDTRDTLRELLRSLRGVAPDHPLNETGDMAHRVLQYKDVIDNKQPNQDVIDNKQPNQDDIDNKQPNQDVIYNKQPNQDVIDNKQPNQDVIDNKQPNQDVIRNKQPNQDVLNNKLPNQDVIDNKQPNQDVINNKQPNQSNKKPYRNVNSKKRPDQDAEGVNTKTGNLTYLLGTLLLVLAKLPFTGGTRRDFKWLPTNDTVKGIYGTDIQLVWKYESNVLVDKIDISRNKTKHEKENIAFWTQDGGSKPNRLISTDVTLEHRKERDVGTIILTLINAYLVDFDKMYVCLISWENGLESMEKELQSYKIEYRPVTEEVKGRPGEDVTLVWRYKYPRPVEKLIFYNNIHNQEEMMTWTNRFEDVEDDYKNRLMLNMTSNHDQVEITLTLLNTTVDDYNHVYFSRVIVEGGHTSLASLSVTERGNKVEQKLDENRKERGSSSTASGVFTSNFWMCGFCVALAFSQNSI